MNDLEKDQLTDKIAKVFASMNLVEKYELLRTLGFPEFITQTVEIDKTNMKEAARSLVDCTADNGPEYVNLLYSI